MYSGPMPIDMGGQEVRPGMYSMTKFEPGTSMADMQRYMEAKRAGQIQQPPGAGGMLGASASGYSGQLSPAGGPGKTPPMNYGTGASAPGSSLSTSAGQPQTGGPMAPPPPDWQSQGYGSALEMFRAQQGHPVYGPGGPQNFGTGGMGGGGRSAPQYYQDPRTRGVSDGPVPWDQRGGPNNQPRRPGFANPAPGMYNQPGGAPGTHRPGGYGNNDPNRPNLSNLAPWLTQPQFR